MGAWPVSASSDGGGGLRRAPMCDDCQSQSESARADAVMSLSDFFYPVRPKK